MDYIGILVFIATGLGFFFLAIFSGVKALINGTSDNPSEAWKVIGFTIASALWFTLAVTMIVIKVKGL